MVAAMRFTYIPGQVMSQIVYISGSGDAMLGTKAVKAPKPMVGLSDCQIDKIGLRAGECRVKVQFS